MPAVPSKRAATDTRVQQLASSAMPSCTAVAVSDTVMASHDHAHPQGCDCQCDQCEIPLIELDSLLTHEHSHTNLPTTPAVSSPSFAGINPINPFQLA